MSDMTDRVGAANPASAKTTSGGSALGPFRHPTFAVLWTATVISNIGTWMNDVGASWLMTSLAPSPLMVSLVQAATALPIFLFALPAGALADIVDRRKLLLVVTAVMAVTAMILGWVVLAEAMTPLLLLFFTFALGAGAAFVAPSWQAIVPKLVPRDQLQPAVALNSVGVNISRAIGPALGGGVIVALGVAWPFLLNAVTFLSVILALLWWRPPAAPPSHLPAERFWSAIRTGFRYARASGPLKATLIRAVVFFLFASAYWALLPLIVRQELGGGPALYGILLGCIGAGAVGGAFLLPALKERFGPDNGVALGTLGTAVALLVFAFVREPLAVAAASALAGASWIAILSNLNVSAQVALPEWVRARGLSVFITVFFGSMTLGSLIWGQVAGLFGISTALVAAAVGAVLGIVGSRPFKLQQGAGLDLTPSMHWPAPVVAGAVEPDRGPVMVTVEYRIDPKNAAAFLEALHTLADARRRDGAFAWGVFEDVAFPGRYLEYFLEASWLEHLRHHERTTEADHVVQDLVLGYHQGEDGPRVSHFLAPAVAGEAAVSSPLDGAHIK
jgi:predicted MFS family arabinose efflux permease